MSIAIPQWLTFLLVGAGLVGVVLALIMAVRAYSQARRGEYYVIREEARRTALRAALLILLFAALVIVFLLFPRQMSTPEPTSTATLLLVASSTPTRAPPTVTATGTPIPKPTATEPFIPTSTPQATLPITLTTPFPSAVAPPGDARFEFWTLAEGVDENNQPANPSARFPVGIERVYVFFHYNGLLPNVPWSVVWYGNGEFLTGHTNLWEPERPLGERYEFLGLGAFPEGEYEVQIWMGDKLQIRVAFSVTDAEE